LPGAEASTRLILAVHSGAICDKQELWPDTLAHYMMAVTLRVDPKMKLFCLDSRPQIYHIECMKAVSKFLGSAFLGLCTIIGCAGSIHAQIYKHIPVSGPVSIFTTGGTNYAEYTWVMGMCLNMVSRGPVIRNGNHFSYNFELEDETFELKDQAGPGKACPMILWIETDDVVLGTLAPGTYFLTTTSWGVPIATTKFIVPRNSGRQPRNHR